MRQPYPEANPKDGRPLGAQVMQGNLCKHKWILTQRIPTVGYYSNGVNGKKQYVDLEFVCPECGKIKIYTRRVDIND